jgi:hypothetical protein
MNGFKKFIYTLGLLVFVVVVIYILGTNWGYVFAKNVEGQVFQIERITQPTMFLTDRTLGDPKSQSSVTPAEAMYSFAVAIRTKDGQIYTASSEDRKWAVAQKGICVEAKFYPYPPWNLEAGGTYRNARLTSMKECPKDFPPMPQASPDVGGEGQPSNAPTDPKSPAPGGTGPGENPPKPQ